MLFYAPSSDGCFNIYHVFDYDAAEGRANSKIIIGVIQGCN